jgi:hypothetical protein
MTNFMQKSVCRLSFMLQKSKKCLLQIFHVAKSKKCLWQIFHAAKSKEVSVIFMPCGGMTNFMPKSNSHAA